MAFFVLDKDPHSGVLRLPVDAVFATREEALAALSAAVGAGDATVTGQVYVVDLETALPVLVMPTVPSPAATVAPPAPPIAEPEPEAEAAEVESGDAEPTPDAEPEVVWAEQEAEEAEPTTEDEQSEVPVNGETAQGEPPTAEGIDLGVFGAAAGGVSLADALKRAATSLEDEGIVAPASISADDFALEDELLAATDGIAADVPDAVASTARTVAEPMSALDREPAEVLTAPADWPWSNVEAFTEEVVDEDELVVEDTDLVPSTSDLLDTAQDAIEAPLPVSGFDQGESLITSAPPVGEEAYLPRPVILGDYADAGVVVPAEPVESLPEPAVTEIGYEPTGDLDLSAYTCNDCVYSNTCPKVGEVTPAECGTFQWRSS